MTISYLVFDHFFWQDLDELDGRLDSDERLIRIPYQRWHRMARRFFPAEAFEGLQQAFEPALDDAWHRYRQRVDDEVRWMMAAYQPSLFVLPSDAFFYVRPFIESFRRHGVRTFVLQKETTISPMVMAEHSLQVGKWVPFISDFMTVCSERHKQFWVRSGVDPDLIEVTGQPRFDVYARREYSTSRERPRLLYLSYDDAAYLPTDVGIAFDGSWRELRRSTERCLAEMSSSWDITVKVHPQQPATDEWLGPSVVHADRMADTRELIRTTDVVLGFQTTAIYEAAVAGKPVIYAAWGPTFERMRDTLIPFHDVPGLVHHAASSDDLQDLFRGDVRQLTPAPGPAVTAAEEHIGPVDGNAAVRALMSMRKFTSNSARAETRLLETARRAWWPLAAVGVRVAAPMAKRLRPQSAGRINFADADLRQRSAEWWSVVCARIRGGSARSARHTPRP